MRIFYFHLVCFTFSISYSGFPFHLVYVFQFLCLSSFLCSFSSLYQVQQKGFCVYIRICMDFPNGSAGKESTHNAGDVGSISGLGRSPWRRERLTTPVFWPGEFHRLYSPWSCKESVTTEQLSLHIYVYIQDVLYNKCILENL